MCVCDQRVAPLREWWLIWLSGGLVGWLDGVVVGSLYDWLFHTLVSQLASDLFIE